MATLKELGQTFLAQLYEIITGGDGKIPPAANNFVSWCLPGFAFTPDEFDFAVKGILSGTDAEDLRRRQLQAFNFATFVDFIPTVEGIYHDDQQQKVFAQTGKRLSSIYGEILRGAKVPMQELTAEEKAKLEELRKFIDETKERYDKKRADYEIERVNYMKKLAAANNAQGTDTSAVIEFSALGDLFSEKVNSAMDEWVSGGFKNEREQAQADINQLTQRGPTIWLNNLKDNFRNGNANATSIGQNFKFTTLIPGNFANTSGWTEYTVSDMQTSVTSQKKTRKWEGSGGINWGFNAFKPSGGGQSEVESGEKTVSSFEMKFELTQVLIVRPWFYPEFFLNRGWTLKHGDGWDIDGMPSDGAEEPKGVMVGYPTSILFIREIEINSKDFLEAYRNEQSNLQAGGTLSWGPIRLGGSHGRTNESKMLNTEETEAGIIVHGMQAIGFINHLIDKAPNPLPEFNLEDFH